MEQRRRAAASRPDRQRLQNAEAILMNGFLQRSVAIVAFVLGPAWLVAGDEPLESWMPDDVIGYVKVSGIGARLDEFLASDFRKELESIDAVKAILSQGQYKKFLRGVEDFKVSSGKDPLKLFQDLLGTDVLVGARLGFAGPEVVLLTRGATDKAIEDGIQTIKGAIEQNGVFLETVAATYGERKIETIADKVSYTTIGSVWAASNSKAALERVIDLSAGKSAASVKKSSVFAKALSSARKGALISAAVRPKFIPNFNIPDKADNAVGSLLLGGWLAALDASELLSASFGVDDGNAELKVASFLGEKARESSEWEKYASFFPQTVPDGVRERLEKRGVLGFVELHRGLADWWKHREELLVPKAAGDLIEFSNVANIIFGRNFQDEVLPDLGPVITIVARNQEYKGLSEKPQPTIPAFAAVFQLKSVKESGESMVSAFYSMIGIINVDRAQKKKEGGMAMIPRPQKVGDIDMHTVSLNTSMAAKDAKPGMMHNFTPSLAVVGSRVILSSSSELSRILIEELSKLEDGKTGAARSADTLTVDGESVRSILTANRDVMVADSMMKKSISKEEAEGQIQVLFDVLKHVRDLRVESGKDGDAVNLLVKLRTHFGTDAAKKEPAPKASERKSGVKL
jgi:hypothetical protein